MYEDDNIPKIYERDLYIKENITKHKRMANCSERAYCLELESIDTLEESDNHIHLQSDLFRTSDFVGYPIDFCSEKSSGMHKYSVKRGALL